MKTKVLGIGLAFIMVALVIVNLAQSQSVPQLINYQGRLTNASGQPINITVPMHFALMDGDTNTAHVLWGETQALVQVNQGIYNVMLGSVHSVPASALSGATVFLEVKVSSETLKPRQRVTSVAYALRAGDATTLAGNTPGYYAPASHNHNTVYYTQAQVDALIAGLQTQIANLQTQVNGHTTDINALDSRVDMNDTDILALQSDMTEAESNISNLQSRMTTAETKLQPVTVAQSGGGTVTDVFFTSVNVHVRSGTGATDGTVNGKGNLIVGYNELRGSGNVRTGSHNLIIGSRNNYSSFGGMVVGWWNTISDTYASVSGGEGNTASGQFSSVSGGDSNTASGQYSSVSGGELNTASGRAASVSAGDENAASYSYASVSGGGGNTASGQESSVSGGWGNTASGEDSSVSAGSYNIASGYSASVSGGNNNKASGAKSSVAGGGGVYPSDGNEAFSDFTAILGGSANLAGDNIKKDPSVGQNATVNGGRFNKASGDYSSVAGGGDEFGGGNEAYANYSAILGGASNGTGDFLDHETGQQATISGGVANGASGYASSVSGGWGNVAGGDRSSVSAGQDNLAGGDRSSVSGGYYNIASGNLASVSGGRNNTASGIFSSVAGGGGSNPGDGNEAFADYSAILGGTANLAGNTIAKDHTIGQQSTVSGGHGNSAGGRYSSVSAGSGNIAGGDYAGVSGGAMNGASGSWASVSGGWSNNASWDYASVSGGELNTASGGASSVSGGHNNTSAFYTSSVSGGNTVSATQNYQWVGGTLHSP